MMVADDAALAKRPAAGEDLVGPIRRNLAQDEGESPPEGGVPGWIRRVLFQEGPLFRHGEGFAILLKRPRAFVVVLRGVGRAADIRERAAQQVVQIRGVLLGDLRVERAGKDLHEVRHVQLEVGGRQRESRGVAQRERVLGDLHIEREGGRAGGGRQGNQGEAVRKRLGVQVALQRAQPQFRMELGNSAELAPGRGGASVLGRAAGETG